MGARKPGPARGLRNNICKRGVLSRFGGLEFSGLPKKGVKREVKSRSLDFFYDRFRTRSRPGRSPGLGIRSRPLSRIPAGVFVRIIASGGCASSAASGKLLSHRSGTLGGAVGSLRAETCECIFSPVNSTRSVPITIGFASLIQRAWMHAPVLSALVPGRKVEAYSPPAGVARRAGVKACPEGLPVSGLFFPGHAGCFRPSP